VIHSSDQGAAEPICGVPGSNRGAWDLLRLRRHRWLAQQHAKQLQEADVCKRRIAITTGIPSVLSAGARCQWHANDRTGLTRPFSKAVSPGNVCQCSSRQHAAFLVRKHARLMFLNRRSGKAIGSVPTLAILISLNLP